MRFSLMNSFSTNSSTAAIASFRYSMFPSSMSTGEQCMNCVVVPIVWRSKGTRGQGSSSSVRSDMFVGWRWVVVWLVDGSCRIDE